LIKHPKFRRFAVAAAKLTVLAIMVWAGHRTIATALSDLRDRGWQLSQLQLPWAVLSGCLYIASQIPCGWFWRTILARLNCRVGLLRALRAFFIGHLGKYVPGKAMVVVLRATLVGQPHVRTSMAVVAVFYETFTTMACGAAIASIYLLAAHRDKPWLILGSLAAAAAVTTPTILPVFRWLLKLMRISRADPNVAVAADVAAVVEATPAIALSPKTVLQGWVAIAIGWAFSGASLWTVLRAIGVENLTLGDWPLCTATVALAVVLGFVSMIPAGFGVRDIALLELLAPRLEQLRPGEGQLLAFVAVIVLRLVWLAAEVVISAVLYPTVRKAKPA
jgi:uncharacterized membrane protein YbhN (UPF0104 family)